VDAAIVRLPGRIQLMVIRSGPPQTYRCSFCNRPQSEVRKLIAGPTAFICDECVEVCNDIIAYGSRFQASDDVEPPLPLPEGTPAGPAVRCALCGMLVPHGDVILVRERGALCLGCAGEVEAAIAERRQSES
jgi:hypothetical protein